jgi:hypothetical protein
MSQARHLLCSCPEAPLNKGRKEQAEPSNNMSKYTFLEPQSNPTRTAPRTADQHTDITRGATHLGIRNQRVLLETAVQEDYAEPDASLGLNTTGVILRVLAQHLTSCPGGGGNDLFEVCLHRREDGRLVELQFAILRARRQGTACLVLSRIGDREINEKEERL